jgi:hypothetical protein
VVLFTASPGVPSQEQEVEQLVRAWAAEGVGLAVYGLGAGWNVPLLTRLADITRGSAETLARPAELAPLLREDLAEPLALADVRLRLRLSRGVRLRRFMQVFPTVAHWLAVQPSERDALVRVGDLPGDRPSYMLAELVVPPQAEGTVRLATLNAVFTGAGGRQGVAPAVDLVVGFGPAAGPPDREVARQAEAFQACALVERALEARREHQPERARTLLENARQLAGRGALAGLLDEAIAALVGGLPVPEGLAIALLMAARRPD